MIAVGMCVDRSYLVPALTSLVSVADTHSLATRKSMSICLLSPDVKRSDVDTFHTIIRWLGFGSFLCRRVNLPTNLPIVHGDYISTTTYLRFAFDTGFIGRPYFLYLDADVLVTGDMTEPFNQLAPNRIGAVIDEINHSVGKGPALPGLTEMYPEFYGKSYFNAGIMWIPLPMVQSVSTGSIHAMRFRKYIHFNDQDALNMWLLHSCACTGISARYNRFELDRFLEESDWISRVVRRIPQNNNTNALHFIGPLKPWLRKSPNTDGVKLYSSFLKSTFRLIRRARDMTMDVER